MAFVRSISAPGRSNMATRATRTGMRSMMNKRLGNTSTMSKCSGRRSIPQRILVIRTNVNASSQCGNVKMN